MTEKQLAVLKVSLRNGFGLTTSCEMCGVEPEYASKFIKSNHSIHGDLLQEMNTGSAMLLSILNNTLAEQKLTEWEQKKFKLRDFIQNLNFWESFCKKSEITPEKVIRAFNIYPITDTPTVLGMTRKELIDYMFTSDSLYDFAQEIGYIK